MGERIRRMTAREVETILQRYGFQLVSQRGSHRKWRGARLAVRGIVPEHQARQLPLGAPRNILTTAEIPEQEWKI